MTKKILQISILSLILIGIDQLTKYLFCDLKIGNQIPIISSITNEGIARGIQIPMRIVIAISLICIGVFIYLFHIHYLSKWDFILLISGTVGNLIDRIWLGNVRDFISLGHFPVFNVADMLLTGGVALILIKEIFHLQSE